MWLAAARWGPPLFVFIRTEPLQFFFCWFVLGILKSLLTFAVYFTYAHCTPCFKTLKITNGYAPSRHPFHCLFFLTFPRRGVPTTHTNTHTHTHIHTCVPGNICVCLRAYVCVCVYTWVCRKVGFVVLGAAVVVPEVCGLAGEGL